MLEPSMDPDLVSSISWNYKSNTYTYMNKKNKNTPTQQVDNQMAGFYVLYNKYYVQSLKTSSEYCKKKLVVNRNSF